ncbi:ATP-binding protein [Anabaena sp. PCC 7108]|uniref:ATP-binding protein n=1 Tax=Anabaena sp. PCC 7108 TaxID=163908 RepID=UPI0003450634|nr:ATP-binding protein [Anabaena sp. PCC 7108]
MQEIQEFNQQLVKQRRSSSILIGILLASGFIASVPMFSDSIKHEETLYCNVKSSCRPSKIKRGISFLVDRERRNQLFDNNINVVKILPPEDDKAVSYGLAASLFLLSAYGVSKALTDSQEKSIHSQFKLLKIKALETDIIEQNHIDIFQFSKQGQAEVAKQSIAREVQKAIQKEKSEGELQLDYFNGQLQGQLSLKGHQLQLSELDKETAKNNLETLETQRKIDKLNKPVQDAKTPTPNEELKNSLTEVLKGHEDGWLWTVIKAAKPLWIIGEQGTGKTNTSVAIALIRKYCLNIPVYRIADRHLNGANSKVWKLLEAQLKADNDSAIIETLQDTYERRLERIGQDLDDKQSEQFLLDEFTHLKDLDKETVQRFIKSTFSDTRKAKERFIGVTHLGTNEAFGEGTDAMRKAGSILIEKFSADGDKPLSRVVIKHGLVDADGNKLKDVEYTLPKWFEANKIYQHFNGKPINFDE